jgi:hypothetical protein
VENSDKSFKKEEILYKGVKITVESRDLVEGRLRMSRFNCLRKNGELIGKTILKITDETSVLNLSPDQFDEMRRHAAISTQFLTCFSNEPMKEMIIYEFDEHIQMKKVLRILWWAEKHPEFDKGFACSMYVRLQKGDKLTEAQEQAIDNILVKWKVPKDWR